MRLSKIITAGIVLICAVFTLYTPTSHAHTNEVSHTDVIKVAGDGFTPEFLEIETGTKITWKNDSDKSIWIASGFDRNAPALDDEYPQSGECGKSALDSCGEVLPGKTFSLTFEHAGVWPLHNALNPTQQMVVRASSKGAKPQVTPTPYPKVNIATKLINKFTTKKQTPGAAAKSAKRGCDQKRKEGVGPFLCYANAYADISYRYGSEFAIESLYELQDIDPVALGCHFIAHGIGWGSYRRDPEKWSIAMQKSSPACSYGEQMGLIEQYVLSLPDGALNPDDVEAICGDNPIADCNHAVGHMMLLNTNNDFKKATELCDGIQKKQQRFMCYHGAFMERFISSNLIDHGLLPQSMGAWPARTPLNVEICKSYGTSELGHACWREIVHPAVLYYRSRVEQVFRLCEQAPDPEFALTCKYHSLPEFAGQLEHNFEATRKVCEVEKDEEFRGNCYRMLVSLKMQFSSFEQAADSPAFCASIDQKFQRDCFQNIAHFMPENLQNSQRLAYCDKAPNEYKDLCAGSTPNNGLVPRFIRLVQSRFDFL